MEVNKDVTLKEFENLCEIILSERTVIEEKQKEVKNLNSLLEEKENKLLAYLEHFEKDKHHAFGHTFYIHNRFTVSMPKELEEKRAFLSHLKGKGEDFFDSFITVNSQTLNAWYKQEMEAAIETGNVDFKIPGLSEPKHYKSLAIRKG